MSSKNSSRIRIYVDRDRNPLQSPLEFESHEACARYFGRSHAWVYQRVCDGTAINLTSSNHTITPRTQYLGYTSQNHKDSTNLNTRTSVNWNTWISAGNNIVFAQPASSASRAKRVKCIDPLGSVFIYDSTRECERVLGVDHGLVASHCRMLYGTNIVQSGVWAGWSFEYI